jgi:predicted dehydrogenase
VITIPTNWGILGCGRIAHAFAIGLKSVPNAELTVVASRTEGKAKMFSETYNVKTFYDNYEDLVNNSSVDVIYIATTHNFHHDNALLCLNHGKHVLCEKTFTLNASQAEEVINTARKHKLFLMEAMWTRFFPCAVKLRELLEEGTIGEIKSFRADFCKRMKVIPEERFLDPNLGGGALLDLGIYPISFASMVYKRPPSLIKSSAYVGETGVDESSSYLFEYENGETAMLSSSFTYTTPHTAFIFGTKGYVEIPNFFHPSNMVLKLERKPKKRIKMPHESIGYNYEAIEVMNCINKGKLESDIMPLDETLEIMKTMDILRSQWGFKYPVET